MPSKQGGPRPATKLRKPRREQGSATLGFDPNGAAIHEGIFGLPEDDAYSADAEIQILPVPWEATTSYGGGASAGPANILEGSKQVELYHEACGDFYKPGIFMHPPLAFAIKHGHRARKLAKPIIERGGDIGTDTKLLTNRNRVNLMQTNLQMEIRGWTGCQFAEGKIPAILGGDHSVPLGAFCAAAEHQKKKGFSILQIDAHRDGREAFEGFDQSHASIMFNALNEISNLNKIVQVGVRAFCRAEQDWTDGSKRVSSFPWRMLSSLMAIGVSWDKLCKQIVDSLGKHVWISFDIDGLRPELCRSTGTPVPGGLDLDQARLLIETVVRSGRTIIGFDLVEVGPDPQDGFNAALLLADLCAYTAASQGLLKLN